ncbi:MAG: twin-arginine translocation signal domain-containing protein [Xanthobacteraceae bacterium]
MTQSRRSFLTFLGLAPVAAATGAVASAQHGVFKGAQANDQRIDPHRHVFAAYSDDREVVMEGGRIRIREVMAGDDDIEVATREDRADYIKVINHTRDITFFVSTP